MNETTADAVSRLIAQHAKPDTAPCTKLGVGGVRNAQYEAERPHDYVMAVQPHDSEMDVSDRFVSLKLSESSDIDAVSKIADIVQPSVTKLDAGSSFATATPPESGVERSDTVTITIGREDAKRWASDDDHIHATAWGPVDKAIREALEEQR